MRIYDILREASDDSGDYQQMLAFTRANRVGGVPDEQQIPLALFKELKKQQQQNQALGAELDAAEQRIDQATASGKLSQRELGMHRTELDRERAAGDQQRAAVTQLGQQYTEREKASGEQIQQLTGQLQQVRNMPGVDKKTAEDLEKKIKELSKNSVPVDRLAELESSIAAVQSMQTVDDTAIRDLVAQVKDAQTASKELEKTKKTVSRDAEETARRALDQVEQIKQQLAHFQEVEAQTTLLAQRVGQLTQAQNELSKQTGKMQTAPDTTDMAQDAIVKQAGTAMMMPREPNPQMSLPGVDTPTPAAGDQIELPGIGQPESDSARAQNLVGRIKQTNPIDKAKVYESAFNRSIAWATGKRS